MFRSLCRRTFLIIGAFMVLLALVLALSIELDATQAQARQLDRAYVAQAVSQLEGGCLICHDLVNAAPSVERTARVGLFDPTQNDGPLALLTPDISNKTTSVFVPLQDQLNTQLIQTGNRILNLPYMQNQRFETVVETYLYVYAQTSAAPGKTMTQNLTQWALWQLDGLENVLRGLENQASPYQLARRDNRPTSSNTVALQTLHTLTTAPGVAMIVDRISVGDSTQMQFAHLDVTQLAMPQEVVYATHRRGPPASMALDSVL